MKCDMHVHSSLSSDSYSTLPMIAKAAKRAGIDAVVIANHNQILPQEQLNEVKDSDIYFIPAVEYSTDAGHVIALFTQTPIENLGVYPNNKIYPHLAVIDAIHKLHGTAILAHPFTYHYNPSLETLAQFDGIEAANSRSGFKLKGRANVLAREAAEKSGLMTAGSDGHFAFEVGRSYVELNISPPYTKEKIIAALSQNPPIFSRSTHPVVLAASQVYKGFSQRNYPHAIKNILKLIGRIPLICPLLFGVRPYERKK